MTAMIKGKRLLDLSEMRDCPTKEEILWAMSANGLGEYDMAFVEKGYEQAVEFEG